MTTEVNPCVHKYRKIPRHHENFIDNYILDSISMLEPLLLKITNTPNYVTTFRLCMFLYASHNFYQSRTKDNAVIFVLAYCLNYYLDCLDGYLARRCKNISKLGDMLDHISDLTSTIIMYYFLFPLDLKYNILLILSAILVSIHMGNQQKHYSKQKKNKEDESLDSLMWLSNKVNIPIEISRYFGCGSSVVMIALIFILKYKLISF